MQVLQVLRRWVILQTIGKGHLRPKKRLITSTKINKQWPVIGHNTMYRGEMHQALPGNNLSMRRRNTVVRRRQRASDRESEKCPQVQVEAQVKVNCLLCPLKRLLGKLKDWLLL